MALPLRVPKAVARKLGFYVYLRAYGAAAKPPEML